VEKLVDAALAKCEAELLPPVSDASDASDMSEDDSAQQQPAPPSETDAVQEGGDDGGVGDAMQEEEEEGDGDGVGKSVSACVLPLALITHVSQMQDEQAICDAKAIHTPSPSAPPRLSLQMSVATWRSMPTTLQGSPLPTRRLMMSVSSVDLRVHHMA
jgi:hypothetical protein